MKTEPGTSLGGQITSFKMPACSPEIEAFGYVCSLGHFAVAAHDVPQSSVCVTRSKGAPGERANLSWFIPHGVKGNPASRSSTVLSTVFPGDLSASCQSVCMPLLVEEHRGSWRNPCERQGFGAFGRPVSKEVSDIPVLPLESLLSR